MVDSLHVGIGYIAVHPESQGKFVGGFVLSLLESVGGDDEVVGMFAPFLNGGLVLVVSAEVGVGGSREGSFAYLFSVEVGSAGYTFEIESADCTGQLRFVKTPDLK